MSVIYGISSLFLVRFIILVASLSFLGTIILSERKHPSIPYLTSRSQKNYSCVMDMTMSDSDKKIMAESSIWWVVLSDITNAFCAW